ncbi:hypothetical protein DRN94_001685 [archaeon]|nr:hypothetical protein [archaeon]
MPELGRSLTNLLPLVIALICVAGYATFAFLALPPYGKGPFTVPLWIVLSPIIYATIATAAVVGGYVIGDFLSDRVLGIGADTARIAIIVSGIGVAVFAALLAVMWDMISGVFGIAATVVAVVVAWWWDYSRIEGVGIALAVGGLIFAVLYSQLFLLFPYYITAPIIIGALVAFAVAALLVREARDLRNPLTIGLGALAVIAPILVWITIRSVAASAYFLTIIGVWELCAVAAIALFWPSQFVDADVKIKVGVIVAIVLALLVVPMFITMSTNYVLVSTTYYEAITVDYTWEYLGRICFTNEFSGVPLGAYGAIAAVLGVLIGIVLHLWDKATTVLPGDPSMVAGAIFSLLAAILALSLFRGFEPLLFLGFAISLILLMGAVRSGAAVRPIARAPISPLIPPRPPLRPPAPG